MARALERTEIDFDCLVKPMNFMTFFFIGYDWYKKNESMEILVK